MYLSNQTIKFSKTTLILLKIMKRILFTFIGLLITVSCMAQIDQHNLPVRMLSVQSGTGTDDVIVRDPATGDIKYVTQASIGGGGGAVAGLYNEAFAFSYGSGTISPAASGTIRFNNALPQNATQLYISKLNTNSADVRNLVGLITNGSAIYIQKKEGPNDFIVYTVNGNPINNSGDYTIPVSTDNNLGSLSIADDLIFSVMINTSTTVELDPIHGAWLVNPQHQADLIMSGWNIKGLADGTDPSDAVTKQQLDAVGGIGGSITVGQIAIGDATANDIIGSGSLTFNAGTLSVLGAGSFLAQVQAGQFVQTGGTSDDILLADGSTTSLSGLGVTETDPVYNSEKSTLVQTTGDQTIDGSKQFVGSISADDATLPNQVVTLQQLEAAGIADGTVNGSLLEWNGSAWIENTTAGFDISSNFGVQNNLIVTGTIAGSNLSGTNTGDQDLSNYVDMTTNQSAIAGEKTFTEPLYAAGQSGAAWDGDLVANLQYLYDNYQSITEGGFAGETLATGDICYQGLGGKWFKADADELAQVSGRIRRVDGAGPVDTWLSFTGSWSEIGTYNTGDVIYLSNTPGQVTNTIPTTGYARILGTASSTTQRFFFTEAQNYVAVDGLSVNGVPISTGGGGIGGTIADNQIAVGNGTDAIDGSASLTYDGTLLVLDDSNSIRFGSNAFVDFANSDIRLGGLATTTGVFLSAGTNSQITLSAPSVDMTGALNIEPATGNAQINLNPDLGQGTINILQTGDYDMKFELLGTGDYSFYAGAQERLNISDLGLLTATDSDVAGNGTVMTWGASNHMFDAIQDYTRNQHDAKWTLGIGWSDGDDVLTASGASGDADLNLSPAFLVGDIVKIIINVSSHSLGSLTISVEGSSSAVVIDDVGKYELVIDPLTSTHNDLKITTTTDFTGTISQFKAIGYQANESLVGGDGIQELTLGGFNNPLNISNTTGPTTSISYNRNIPATTGSTARTATADNWQGAMFINNTANSQAITIDGNDSQGLGYTFSILLTSTGDTVITPTNGATINGVASAVTVTTQYSAVQFINVGGDDYVWIGKL